MTEKFLFERSPTMINEYITYAIMLEYEPESVKLKKVQFKKDLGPWKSGQIVEFLRFDLELAAVYELDSENRVINSCMVRMVAA